MKTALFIFGTRPEAIKLAPLIKAFEHKSSHYKTIVCVTGQHREMLDQVLNFFRITPQYDLNIMQAGQSLFKVTAQSLQKLKDVFLDCKPDIVFVQGDTTTTFVGALAAFYNKINVAHIEAGLRSKNKYYPFPEEINRKLVSNLTDYHFAPTQAAVDNLHGEGIQENLWKVGNTGIDALFLCLQIIREKGEARYRKKFSYLDFSKKIILVTCHRRETFGQPFQQICEALKTLVEQAKDIHIVYPVHLNPSVKKTAHRLLDKIDRIHLISPLDYPSFVWLMSKSYLIITDSGGIQEEVPSLGKPVIVIRDVTERAEGIQAGTAILAGTQKESILHETNALLQNKDKYEQMINISNPYGDGTACSQIITIINRIKKST